MNIIYINSFVLGFLSFFSPCIIPLTPVYIGYILQTILKKTDNGNSFVFSILNIFSFFIGASLIYIFTGTFISFFSNLVRNDYILVERVLGIFLFFVVSTNYLKYFKYLKYNSFIYRIKNIDVKYSFIKNFLAGFALTANWIPCSGIYLSLESVSVIGLPKIESILSLFIFFMGLMFPLILFLILFSFSINLKFLKNIKLIHYFQEFFNIFTLLISLLLILGVYNIFTSYLFYYVSRL